MIFSFIPNSLPIMSLVFHDVPITYQRFLGEYFINSESITKEIIDSFKKASQNEDDLGFVIALISSLFHEYKHYHDLLLSPTGAQLSFQWFSFTSWTPLFLHYFGASTSEKINLPLTDLLSNENEIEDEGLKIYLKKAREDLSVLNQWSGPYRNKDISLEAILESAAINTQLNYIRFSFGDKGLYVFRKYFYNSYVWQSNTDPYTNANTVLTNELGHDGFLSENIGNTILFASLCGKSRNEDRIWRPSEVFEELVDYFKGKIDPYSRVNEKVYQKIDEFFHDKNWLSIEDAIHWGNEYLKALYNTYAERIDLIKDKEDKEFGIFLLEYLKLYIEYRIVMERAFISDKVGYASAEAYARKMLSKNRYVRAPMNIIFPRGMPKELENTFQTWNRAIESEENVYLINNFHGGLRGPSDDADVKLFDKYQCYYYLAEICLMKFSEGLPKGRETARDSYYHAWRRRVQKDLKKKLVIF